MFQSPPPLPISFDLPPPLRAYSEPPPPPPVYSGPKSNQLKIVYLEKNGKILTLCILKKEAGKCSNTFDQLLIY